MAAHQAPLSLGFCRQEHWSGLPFPSPMHESEKSKWSHSVTSDSLWPHGLQPTRFLHSWDFPGKSTGVGCPLSKTGAALFSCLYGSPCHYSGKRNRLESVPYPYLSTPCTLPPLLPSPPRNLACCVCIHHSGKSLGGLASPVRMDISFKSQQGSAGTLAALATSLAKTGTAQGGACWFPELRQSPC